MPANDNRFDILNSQIYKAGNIFNDRVAFTGVTGGNKNTIPEDNRPVTAIMNEIYDYINEDLSVLPNPAGPDVLSRTPNEIKSYLNPAGLKHMTSLINEIFLLKADKRVDQLWYDGIYYTGHLDNYGTVMLMDIQPKQDLKNPFSNEIINHFQFYGAADQNWHISAHNRTDTNQDTDVIGDSHHGKISYLTKDINKPILAKWENGDMLNDDYERTEDIQSNLGDPETLATMDPDADNLYLVVNQSNRTTVKYNEYMSRTARTIDHFSRFLQDGKHGRSWILDSRDHVRYYNQLTLRMDYRPGMDSTQFKEPQTAARIIDIPVHTRDLENIHPTNANSHGSKDKDDTNFDFYLPYADDRTGEKYLGVENRETASVDDYYCKKNDFNWFWNHYNNKMKYVDYDRNQLWTAINRLRNTGHFLGYVYEYSHSNQVVASNNTPEYGAGNHANVFPDYILNGQKETQGSSSVPGYTNLSNLKQILNGQPNRITRENPGITTWNKLRTILSCDENRVAFDNDYFIVQHNNDRDTFEPYNRTTGAFEQSVFSESGYIRLDYDYILNVYGSMDNYLRQYYGHGTSAGDNNRPAAGSIQNVNTNRYGSDNRAGGTIQIRQTKSWEDQKSQMGDFYTYKARVYRIMNMDPNQYRKDGNDGRPGDIPIYIYPDIYLDQMGRVFCDPQQPLGRGRIKTLELEDNAVTMEKLDLRLQYFFRQAVRMWVYYSSSEAPPCGDVTQAGANPATWPAAQQNFPGIYDYRTPGTNAVYTSPTTQGGRADGAGMMGCNVAFNAYTRVLWVCVTNYSRTKIDGSRKYGDLANMGWGTFIPVSGVIFP